MATNNDEYDGWTAMMHLDAILNGSYDYMYICNHPNLVLASQNVVIFSPKIKGVTEWGKDTNTHLFFFGALPAPTPYLPNMVCFFHIYVFSNVL